ncbi:sensor domain-containing diguanylate cyclase [Sphingomonas immobilis]|uniref:diguanylate cyclase n=1 Tax=Sphingomonas immobilis TaxID=3063997 RepID=A0ABT8ZWS2_9SPHN|nr:diguanylate cyclase [Sphingomonas sp. CA1-15]MDO7841667.1 diguanylate cyclase [Sphingomonas sp. CA1-15]
MFATFASYAILTFAASELMRAGHGIALMWLANGPLLAVLCAVPTRRWPPLLAAAFAGGLSVALALYPLHWGMPCVIASEVAEAAIAAWLLRRWDVDEGLFQRVGTVPLFAGACIVAALASGVPVAAIAAATTNNPFPWILRDWMIGHALGLLILTPTAFVLLRRDEWAALWSPRRAAVAVAMVALVSGTAIITFGQDQLPLLFLPALPVVIATFAMQRVGAALSIGIIAAIGGYLTAHGHGPVMLMQSSAVAHLQFFQIYLAALFATALPIAAMLTQRAALVRDLAESEARYRLLADNVTDIMLTLAPDATIRFASPSVREITSLDPASLVGTPAINLVLEDDRDRIRGIRHDAMNAPGRTVSVEFRVRKPDGTITWFESNFRAVEQSDTDVAVVCVLRDLGGRKSREAELERAASTDALTGLLNRNAFRDRVVEGLRSNDPPGALALIDLDHFKQVNDRHGHAAGDAALLALADLLRSNLRAEDAIGRIGGEEFAILFAGHTPGLAETICDRLREALAHTEIPTGIPGATDVFSITMSIGVVPLAAGAGAEEHFASADAALYRAKAQGRNRTERAQV